MFFIGSVFLFREILTQVFVTTIYKCYSLEMKTFRRIQLLTTKTKATRNSC